MILIVGFELMEIYIVNLIDFLILIGNKIKFTT